jgi:hypothetical protein
MAAAAVDAFAGVHGQMLRVDDDVLLCQANYVNPGFKVQGKSRDRSSSLCRMKENV